MSVEIVKGQRFGMLGGSGLPFPGPSGSILGPGGSILGVPVGRIVTQQESPSSQVFPDWFRTWASQNGADVTKLSQDAISAAHLVLAAFRSYGLLNSNNQLRQVQVDATNKKLTITDSAHSGAVGDHPIIQAVDGRVSYSGYQLWDGTTKVADDADIPISAIRTSWNAFKTAAGGGGRDIFSFLPLFSFLGGQGGNFIPMMVQLMILKAKREKKGEVWDMLKQWYAAFGIPENCPQNDATCPIIQSTVDQFVQDYYMKLFTPRSSSSSWGTSSSPSSAISNLIQMMIMATILKDFGFR